jgi:hypothetical protein
MPRWHMLRCRFNVTRLIVKEKVGLKLFEKLPLGQAAQKHGLVDFNVPFHQGSYGTLMCRRTAGRHQSSSDANRWGAFLLKPVKGGQQRLERPSQQGL